MLEPGKGHAVITRYRLSAGRSTDPGRQDGEMRLPGGKLGVRHLMALVAIVAVVLCLYLWIDSARTAVWDGSFPLQVTLEDRSGCPVMAVGAQTLAGIEEAEYLLAHPRNLGLHPEDAHWVAGQPFTVRVRCSGHASMTGREMSYTQHKALLVRVEYTDGTNRLFFAEIPDGRVRRRVSVPTP